MFCGNSRSERTCLLTNFRFEVLTESAGFEILTNAKSCFLVLGGGVRMMGVAHEHLAVVRHL